MSELQKKRASEVMKAYWANPKNRKKLIKRQNGSNNSNWKGDKVKIEGLHSWVKMKLPKPAFCDNCKLKPPNDLANKGIYNRSLANWE